MRVENRGLHANGVAVGGDGGFVLARAVVSEAQIVMVIAVVGRQRDRFFESGLCRFVILFLERGDALRGGFIGGGRRNRARSGRLFLGHRLGRGRCWLGDGQRCRTDRRPARTTLRRARQVLQEKFIIS